LSSFGEREKDEEGKIEKDEKGKIWTMTLLCRFSVAE
jgi:hypothetical protein